MNSTTRFISAPLFLFCVMSFSVRFAFAQEQARRWACLDAVHQASHIAVIKASETGIKPLPGRETYIFVCIGGTCTTGDSARDIRATGVDGLSVLRSQYSYVFEGMTPSTNPVPSDANGDIGSLMWKDYTPHSQTRIWMAMNYWLPTDSEAGGAGGQQQGTFNFENASKKCVSIQWDPFGRVFDSQTLEPVPNASVTLLFDKDNNGIFIQMTPSDLMGGAITNPQTTKEDGQFNFVVPDGNYKLSVIPNPVATIRNIHSKYTSAYYDIYLAPGDIIVEQGGVEHRDVPIPTRNTNTEVKIMDYNATQGQGIVYIQGFVSHPLSTITTRIKRVYTQLNREESRDGHSVQSDKMGKFAIEINQAELENTSEYVDSFSGISAQKVNLLLTKSNSTSFISYIQDFISSFVGKTPVSAQSKGAFVAIEPMPSYLEGYAYDVNGREIPRAVVGIYLKHAQKPIYETSADATGYFKIGSEYIPPFEYDLQYKKVTGDVVKTTTSTFLAQNHLYLSESNISAFEYKETKGTNTTIANNKATTIPTVKPTVGSQNKKGMYASGGMEKKGVSKQTVDKGAAFAGMEGIVTTLAVLFVLILVGVGAFIAMKSKGQQTQTF